MRLFIKIFEESLLFRAIARFCSLIAVVYAVFLFLVHVIDNLDSVNIHYIVSAISLLISAYVLITIYDKIYGKFARDLRVSRHPLLGYKSAIIKCIKLSAIDDSYFIAVTWLKASRVLISIPAVLSLLFVIEMDNHSHKMSIYIFDKNLLLHPILDAIIVTSMVALTFFSFWQLAEINVIARGTAVLANKRRNAIARRRFARN